MTNAQEGVKEAQEGVKEQQVRGGKEVVFIVHLKGRKTKINDGGG